MKVLGLIFPLLFFSFISFSQSLPVRMKQINDYKVLVDSLSNLNDSLRKVVTTEADSLIDVHKFGRGVIDGKDYEGYTFFKHDTLIRFKYSFIKNDYVIDEYYYYKNYKLISIDILAGKTGNLNENVLHYVEYYEGTYPIAKRKSSLLPVSIERKLLRSSYYDFGMNLLERFGENE